MLYGMKHHVGGICDVAVDSARVLVLAQPDEGGDAPFRWRATESRIVTCGEGTFVAAVVIDLPAKCTHLSVFAPSSSLRGMITIEGMH